MMRKVFKESLVIFLLSAAAGIAVNMAHPKGYLLVSRSEMRYAAIVPISIEEAGIKHTASSALFVDARDAAEYHAVRIRGALNIPAYPESFSMKRIQEEFPALNRKKELVIYCGLSTCGISRTLAERILGMGYSRNIYLLKEGMPAWISADNPVEKGREER